MSKALKSDVSALERVAQEERKLLALIDNVRSEAKKIVDDAHEEARTILETAEASVARETAEIRRAAEREGTAERNTIHEQAEARLAEAQAGAQAHARQVVGDVLRQILPGEGGSDE